MLDVLNPSETAGLATWFAVNSSQDRCLRRSCAPTETSQKPGNFHSKNNFWSYHLDIIWIHFWWIFREIFHLGTTCILSGSQLVGWQRSCADAQSPMLGRWRTLPSTPLVAKASSKQTLFRKTMKKEEMLINQLKASFQLPRTDAFLTWCLCNLESAFW